MPNLLCVILLKPFNYKFLLSCFGLKPTPYKISKAPDGQGPLLTNYKPKL